MNFPAFLVDEAPALRLGESHIGQRHIDDYRKCGNQQSEPRRSEVEPETLLV
jgi:hypothetical protein